MSAPPTSAPQITLGERARRFWQRVSDGLEVHQLWSQLQRDAKTSYRLYSAGLRERAESRSGWAHFWYLTKALFWAIIEKLSPARRVLLLLGLVLIVFPSGDVAYTDKHGHLESFQLDLHVWGALTILAVLLLELADRVVMKRDLEIAKDIQSWLLPGAPLQIPGYGIAYATRPANTVAGDYYDVILRPGATSNEDRILFVVADVAGKSIPAAMLMATLQASLRTVASGHQPLAEMMVELNRYACSNSQGGARFTTAFLAELDPATGDVTYVNAGHNVPMLRRQSGTIERPEVGGIPIGVLADARYDVGALRMESGDCLVIFTDGVVEALDSRGEEFGEEALIQVVNRGAATTPAELVRSMLAALDSYVGNTPQHDDMTCLLLKRS